jgi:(1->4)-alpha-D-glucan 1-alpha-D-glucosylmutase
MTASVPRATYRLQLGGACTFADATALVPYLAALGVSHVYCSPYTRARGGSPHGYDIVDHNAFNPEIGSELDFDAFVDALRAHGMGHVLDFVPNHMGVGYADNAWWLDLLTWGPDAEATRVFDVDWTPSKHELASKVLVPFLGDHYGTVLERGELQLRFDPTAGTFDVWYHDHRFPIAPTTWGRILGPADGPGTLPQDASLELDGVRAAVRRLRRRGARLPPAERMATAQDCARRLATVAAREPAFRAWIVRRLARLNGVPGRARSFRALHGLLEAQHYRLAYWRVAADEINYRRFFDVNDLAGIRVEDPVVFDRTHALVVRLVREGRLDGLRIDHVDGLFDPRAYCERLRDAVGPGCWLVVEKILAADERLRPEWPVSGTTGYDFVAQVTALLIDPAAEPTLTRTYREVTGDALPFAEIAYACRKLVMNFLLASELHVLANALDHLSEATWRWRDFTTTSLREGLKEVLACFPVYRTYIDAAGACDADRDIVAQAVAAARRRSADPEESLFAFLQQALEGAAEPREPALRFARRVQQLSGPVTAKAVEDTACYRAARLLALNEVGCDPARFGAPPPAFHRAMAERARDWPHAMLTTATHDTKRGEDVRARLCVLSEVPDVWDAHVRTWEVLARRWCEARPVAPDAVERYFLYQTLLGSWPAELTGVDALPGEPLGAYRARVEAYVVKALREAKRTTSWRHPDPAHEQAAIDFVGWLLAGDVHANPFLADFLPFQTRVAVVGALKSLGQVAVKLAAPGVPDLYQGGELWDLSLVDPDNRRPVDFAERAHVLDTLAARLGRAARPDADAVATVLADWRSGAPKLLAISRLLDFRRRHAALLADGGYVPLETRGVHAGRLVAFARVHEDACLVVVAPHLPAAVHRGSAPRYAPGAWGDTAIDWEPLAGWTPTADVIVGTPADLVMTDGPPVLPVDGLLAGFPVVAVQATARDPGPGR